MSDVTRHVNIKTLVAEREKVHETLRKLSTAQATHKREYKTINLSLARQLEDYNEMLLRINSEIDWLKSSGEES